ncbi:glycerol-3-phosphate dehydrogenase [Erysipelothrix larvae]|uniref:Glycerol-3-phosphate dehydrogenase [NAD(P)+] n=1 Tax=Erysipelothrix larvae TaxID=1514105 RepID=A0A109UGZ1_9FIRM|nr:NAD(P)H-dependent glycerol-3-phosphate dehydrogenase [Erysipelothrix larvae]AMC93346.1 glycerol-3-phosphate dehydrogenase [Erysipelothrix larvae]
MKIAIIGSGSWGTALGNVLAQNGHDALIWGKSLDEVVDIQQYHLNETYFPGVKLCEDLRATPTYNDILDADIFLLAIPSIAIESVCQELDKHLDRPVIIINVAKGFHPVTHEYLMEVIERSISNDHLSAVVSLIGPSHAEEVVLNQLTTVNAVSSNEDAARTVQEIFSNDFFRVYRNDDVVGAQIGVAVKNVMALASGIASGLGYGDNTRAALITRGLAEITRYGLYFGGRMDTFLGLCGVGDLVVTATSQHSRNFQAGYDVGVNGSTSHFFDTNIKTVEGVAATKVVYEVAKEKGIDMPITEQVYKVFYEGKDPRQAIVDLMNRELKHETK